MHGTYNAAAKEAKEDSLRLEMRLAETELAQNSALIELAERHAAELATVKEASATLREERDAAVGRAAKAEAAQGKGNQALKERHHAALDELRLTVNAALSKCSPDAIAELRKATASRSTLLEVQLDAGERAAQVRVQIICNECARIIIIICR